MGKLSIGRVLDTLCIAPSCSDNCTCFCINTLESADDDEIERKPLVGSDGDKLLKLKDVVSGGQRTTLAFQLKPKTVVLKVSMHCHGCARKVEKHVSKIEGVTAYKVDLETKTVVVIGDILPFEVLDSISKVKNAQLWTAGI